MKRLIVGTAVLAVGLGLVPATMSQSQADESLPAGVPYPQGRVPLIRTVPPELTLPAGTLITVRTTEMISSDHNKPGDRFTTVLDQPLVAQGWVVARRGQTVEGRIAVAQSAGRVQGVSQLAVELSELLLIDGQQVPIQTELARSTGGTSRGRDVEGIGAATGMGAAIGAAAGGGQGAAIGAAAGAAAGLAGVLTSRGRPTELYPETILTFRLEDPVTIITSQSQQAFLPVTQEDYGDRDAQRNPPRGFRAADSRPLSYYESPYYYYPPRFGFAGYYGYYGYGPRFYVAPRIFIGPRFHRHR